MMFMIKSKKAPLLIGGSVLLLSAGVLAAILTRNAWSAGAVDRGLLSKDSGTIKDTLLSLTEADLAGAGNRGRRDQFVESCKTMPPDALFAVVNPDQLTDEQREKMWENLRVLGEAYIKDVVDDFFKVVNDASTTPEQQTAFLDQQIDNWVPFMESMKTFFESKKDDPAMKAMEDREKERWRNSASRDERKKEIEKRDPDQMARMIFYFRKVTSRAQERGIDLRGGERKPEASSSNAADKSKQSGSSPK